MAAAPVKEIGAFSRHLMTREARKLWQPGGGWGNRTLTAQVPTKKGPRGSSTLYSRYLGGQGNLAA